MKTGLVISSIGMTCAVGHDVLTACASMRCGIVRPEMLPYSTVDEDLEDIFVAGYPIEGYTDGFEGAARYGVIIQEVLADLIRQGSIDKYDEDFWKHAGVIIGITPVREGGDYTPDLDLNLLKTVINDYLPFVKEENIGFVLKGSASAQYAVILAENQIHQGLLQRSLIICVDSLVGSNEINYFMNAGRLKMDDNVDGFIPGEAGAAIIVEPKALAIERSAKCFADISSVVTKETAFSHVEFERQEGADLVSITIEAAGETIPEEIYIDLNGENWRAREWGNAYVKLHMTYKDMSIKTYTPAESLGDTGASHGLISVCAAIQAFERGYSQSSSALILSSPESGELGAMLITNTY